MSTQHLRKFTTIYHKYGLDSSKNLFLLTQIILLGRTVNLWKLKDYIGMVLGNHETKPASHYRRLTRFMDSWSENKAYHKAVRRLIFHFLRRMRFTHLLLDGTSWKRGGEKYQFMVLSVLAGPVAIPIYWRQLGKLGSSSQQERKSMMDEVVGLFDLGGMTLLADREYIGKEWFKYLYDKDIGFVIRLRFPDYYEVVDGLPGKSYQAMYDACASGRKLCRKRIELDGRHYFISMIPNPKKTNREDRVIIFLTKGRPVRKTVDQYVKRWRIECLFRHLKTNGFNLEEMNLKDGKEDFMFLIVCLAYALTIRCAAKTEKSIRQIKFADGDARPAVSIFREGLSNITIHLGRFIDFLRFLISIYNPRNHLIYKNV